MKTMIDYNQIKTILKEQKKDGPKAIEAIFEKALSLEGLTFNEVAKLIVLKDPTLILQLFHTAETIKDKIYGKRLVIFAPLYTSNLCSNECLYCAFRQSNNKIARRALSQEEIATETRHLIEQGHKRALLVSGELNNKNALDDVLESIDTVYNVHLPQGNIRRINVNIAPLSLEEFKRLKKANIGTYQLFQETYHPTIYKQMHTAGQKQDYDFRLSAMNRAMEAGIDDLGIGVLFGLADWRFDLLALLSHADYLNKTYGVGPHTISVPRIEPAFGSDVAVNPPNAVSDDDFKKIIAILRLAVPYTGLILSTRENPAMRKMALALGISQISAGSKTNPGGYQKGKAEAEQFSLGDHRSLDEVILDVAKMGYIPSFCTGCYRLGRTGHEFMDLAKPGEIKCFCEPNAVLTFAEYLLQFGSIDTKTIGEKLIKETLNKMPKKTKSLTQELLNRLYKGEKDLYL